MNDAVPFTKRFGGKKAKKENLGFWRENVEALTVAVVMALTVKLFFFEAFKVPTESMEPAIIGRADGGDRLIVNKFVYMIRDPRRWEVVVFQYPHNTLVNYVKRCVGMPAEWLFIRNGDVYTAPAGLDHEDALAQAAIARKPDDVQDEIFDRSTLIPPDGRGVDAFTRYWVKDADARGVGRVAPLVDDEEVVFQAEAGPTWVSFTRPERERVRIGEGGVSMMAPEISNRRFDDWSPLAEAPSFLGRIAGAAAPARGTDPRPGREDEVGDMRLAFEVMPEAGSGRVLLEIRDGTHTLPISAALAVAGSGGASELVVGEERTALDLSLEPGSWTEVSLANADDRVVLRVDGEIVAERTYAHPFLPAVGGIVGGGVTTAPKDPTPPLPEQPTHDLPHPNGASFGFDGGRARFRGVDLARDAYYTFTGVTDFRIPDDSYLMLGDNSPNSLDARGWKITVLKYRDDDGEVIELVGDAEGVSADESRPMENPFDGDTRFLDRFGNTREIDPARIVERETRYGHYVARDLVLGRAYLTFWPLLQLGAIR